MTLMYQYQQVYEQANRYDQEHIFAFWEELNQKEQEELIEQAKQIDFSFIEKLYQEQGKNQPETKNIQPPKIMLKEKIPQIITNKGKQAIKEGKIALFIVAGGQGSRLGFEGPKGCFPITPIKKKTIFQVLAEKVVSANKTYETKLDLYIMTSKTNHEETKEFFEKNNYFGLEKESIVFFQQQMLPAIDEEGKILLKNKHHIVMAPGGTGGIYQAIKEAKLIERMKEKGIEYLQYVQVDNPLSVIPDPTFLGEHLNEQAEMSNKIVEKAYPEERVGIFVKQEGKIKLIEYIFVPENLLLEKDEEGKIAYRAGNIANHIINRTFIEKVAESENLPYYLAHKKIKYLNKKGETIIPLEPNAYKFESFVFDALPLAKNVALLSVKREEEFAPVKNPEGKDSPDSARNLLVAQAKDWLSAANIKESIIKELQIIEISPLMAATKEEFVTKIKPLAEKINKQLEGQTKAYLS